MLVRLSTAIHQTADICRCWSEVSLFAERSSPLLGGILGNYFLDLVPFRGELKPSLYSHWWYGFESGNDRCFYRYSYPSDWFLQKCSATPWLILAPFNPQYSMISIRGCFDTPRNVWSSLLAKGVISQVVNATFNAFCGGCASIMPPVASLSLPIFPPTFPAVNSLAACWSPFNQHCFIWIIIVFLVWDLVTQSNLRYFFVLINILAENSLS